MSTIVPLTFQAMLLVAVRKQLRLVRWTQLRSEAASSADITVERITNW